MTPMRDDLPTLAERFAAVGYRTVSLSANAWLLPELGLVRGFEDARTFEIEYDVVNAAREVLAQERDEPLFLFLNFTMAHRPYVDTSVPGIEKHLESLEPKTAPEWLRRTFSTGPSGVWISESTRAGRERGGSFVTWPGSSRSRPMESRCSSISTTARSSSRIVCSGRCSKSGRGSVRRASSW